MQTSERTQASFRIHQSPASLGTQPCGKFQEHTESPDMDVRLMLLAQGGDPNAFESLVRKHRGPIIHYVYGMLRDEAISEELAQETFLRVHRNRHLYRPTAGFSPWLYRIAGNLALNWIRDHSRERFYEPLDAEHADRRNLELRDPHVRIDEWLVLRIRDEEVHKAVAELPERQRTVVLLHKFEGLGCERIAEKLQCSHQAVRSLLFRAYTALRSRLAHLDQ